MMMDAEDREDFLPIMSFPDKRSTVVILFYVPVLDSWKLPVDSWLTKLQLV